MPKIKIAIIIDDSVELVEKVFNHLWKEACKYADVESAFMVRLSAR